MDTQRRIATQRMLRRAGPMTKRIMVSRRSRRFVALASQQDRRDARRQVGLLSHALLQPVTLQ
eukprot:1728496-Pyramimonas_sp.AAC.1